ncbi:GNAT family N-acetyltransferase [Arthrobacter sp. KBS0703]|uniref:GNAT family N-acetyltransferase n=1 Tax=Arthrobacter sp. KBS0703 TaxID=1955698 RepID=UPI0011871157|nr:GNAT family N-acetyltransferase [Arthrobacter sp. KBS0703]TSE16906.1 GNAT family N-acetyltransferase [Arthrobacter sp. KBS0703]
MPVLPSGVTVRRIGPGDAASLNALARTDNVFDQDPATERWGALTPDGARDFLSDPSVLFWLAEADGQVVGFLHCYVQRRRSSGPWAELLLMEMGTHADWRRRGIGRGMVAAMEAWMKENGVAEVWVPANTYAAGFYRKCGFVADEGEILVKELH